MGLIHVINNADTMYVCVYILQASTNGYFSMGEEPQISSLEIFCGSSNYSVVAPFAADTTAFQYVDGTYDKYHGTQKTSSFFSRYNSEMREVSAHIRSETGVSFHGTWMLVADWKNVSLLSGNQVSLRMNTH